MAVALEILRETIALGKTGAGKALTEEVGLLLSSSVKNLPSDLTKLGESTVGGLRAPAQVKHLEELYRNAPIRFFDRPGDLFDSSIRTGTIQGQSGLEHVVVTKPPMVRQQKELAAYAIHQQSPFTNHFPITVERAGGKELVQERVGRTLDNALPILDRRFYGQVAPPMPPIDAEKSVILQWKRTVAEQARLSPGMRDLLQGNPVFRDQMEQSVAERLIWGDKDGHRGNVALIMRNRLLNVANIDMEMAFSTRLTPNYPKLIEFQDQVISPSTLGKIDAFQQKFSSNWGRTFLADLKLSREQSNAMLARSSWLLNEGRFPARQIYSGY